jgi:hypothetical protein
MFESRKLEDVPVFTTDRSGFEIAFGNMTRMWFEDEGMAANRAFARMAPYPEMIFVRNDNWSIGCLKKDADIVFELWKEKWTHIIKLAQ